MYAWLGSACSSPVVTFCLFAIPGPDVQDSLKLVPGVMEMRPLQSGGVMAPGGHICLIFCACIFEVPNCNFPLVLYPL